MDQGVERHRSGLSLEAAGDKRLLYGIGQLADQAVLRSALGVVDDELQNGRGRGRDGQGRAICWPCRRNQAAQ
jgi:hypothetical protein